MRSRITVSFFCLAFASALADAARGDSVYYSFAPALGTGGQDYAVSVSAGGRVDVPVYLVFDSGAAADLSANLGLFSADVAIRRLGSGPSDPAGILSSLDVTGNAAFNDPI